MRRALVLLLLFVSCSACTAWVVKTAPPADDDGWMRVCWVQDEDDPHIKLSAFYESGCEGAPMVEVRWKHLPIRVALTEAAEPYRADLEKAVAHWNAEVGFELFQITRLGWDVTILADLRSPLMLRGATQFAMEAGVMDAAVYVYMYEVLPGDAGTVETFEHELGHVVGLKHDRLKTSLMYDTYEGKPGRTLTAYDRMLVKHRYGVAH